MKEIKVQCQVGGRLAGAASANRVALDELYPRVKILEHFEALAGDFSERDRLPLAVKQQGIPLDFRQREFGAVRLDQQLQQFVDDV